MYRYRKTPKAALEVGEGVTYMNLYNLIRNGKIPPPERDSSGDFIWSDADIERARKALALRKRRKQNAQETAAGATR
jgi:hypothetical protein